MFHTQKESNRHLLDELSRVNRNTEYSSTTSRRGRCYQICIVVWAAAVIKLCICDFIRNLNVEAIEMFLIGLWWSTTMWIQYLLLLSSSLLLHCITETIDRLQDTIEECTSYMKLHEFESLTQNVVPLIDDDFGTKFCDLSHNVLAGVGKSYNSLCRCTHLFNEVFGSVNIFERCMQIIHITIMTLGIILVAKGGENVQRAACDLKRSLTRLNYEAAQDGRLTTMCKSLRSLLRAMSSSRLNVSSCGLFYLRMSLVTGFISFTSTYAIVVLQLTHLI
ncbi:hypothetical protein EVAR_97917_1 [Eumeta japonica]|uniref:Uncharacterized protein n=1 Tax=Eumeta variegata TaxID=151549 RepID=A0A4C1XY99_EUMVA|nr:hypothetical protein EVAR_97917_1 [Eumeta japonica]